MDARPMGSGESEPVSLNCCMDCDIGSAGGPDVCWYC